MEAGQHAGLGLHYTFPFLLPQLLLPCPLRYGTEISIQGTIPSGASRFSVNLQAGTSQETVVFHFNPRFSERPVVVRNTRTEGSWGEEECSLASAKFPFAHKEDFRMVITPNEKGFQVVVDGSHQIFYEHRLPLEDVTHLCVEGDVFVRSVDIAVALPSKLLASIPNNLRQGDLIIIKGEVPSGSNSFMVNLQEGPTDQDDICLHINPRFDEGAIIRNTRLKNMWGSEHTDGGIPLTQGKSFVLVVAALLDFYMIWINDKHFANYDHRCPLGSAAYLVVDGDVTLSEVYIDSEPKFLSAQLGARKVAPSDIHAQAVHPKVPSCVAIPGGLAPGRVLIVVGVPSEGAKRFCINLQIGPNEKDADMPLHFSPRWDEGCTVALNARQDGKWGTESVLSLPAFPFAIGSLFHFAVQCLEDAFVILLNDQQLATYPHQMNPSNIDCVTCSGHLYVRRILII